MEPGNEKGLVAFALFVTAVVFTVAAIANNNLQDLKTGQLVDATPSKQQWALVVGVIAGAAVIPPILDLLNRRTASPAHPARTPSTALAAPQAGLISALAQGVIQNNIDWSLIGIGARDRRGADRARRSAAPHDEARAPVAAGGGPGHLPADLGDADGGRRRRRRLRSTTGAPNAARARKRRSNSACCSPPA